MRKLVLVLSCAGVAFALALPGIGLTKNDADKVTICHFEGHTAANVTGGDFVTFNSLGNNPVCVNEGGNPITVSPEACENGHHAVTRYTNRSCADGALQP